MYKFEKYGFLMEYVGIPVYVGNTCISPKNIVWWFPWNWFLILCASPVALYRALLVK